MARGAIILTGRTELLAALYDEENLPTAIVRPVAASHYPMCVHSLREGDESLFNDFIQEAKAGNEKADEEQLKFELYKFFEQYPSRDHECSGCRLNSQKDSDVVRHLIKDTKEHAVKLCEDCP